MSCCKLQQVLCLTQKRLAKQQFLLCGAPLLSHFCFLPTPPTQPPLNLAIVFRKLCRFHVLLIVFIQPEFKFENR